jgi:hypothetical protein
VNNSLSLARTRLTKVKEAKGKICGQVVPSSSEGGQMQKVHYEVTSDFTVFRQPDQTPKQLRAGFHVSAHESLHDTVIVEIGSERFESDKGVFPAHTITIRPSVN